MTELLLLVVSFAVLYLVIRTGVAHGVADAVEEMDLPRRAELLRSLAAKVQADDAASSEGETE
ncbi:hypothetical protein GCM10022215_37200 [Nocardioides fonticola]|uniref:Uncharacterized protein n=1 Tax=Nocardioides fonticola TaxID=450363 RepID=A0ABP7XWF5_9ACTN